MRDPDYVLTPFSTGDERDKIKQMQAYAAQAAKTPDELMIEKLNAQIAKSQASVASLENTATELGALNPSAMTKAKGETNTQFNARVKAAEAAARTAAAAENPLLNKAVKPTDAPPGKYYAWIGGTNTGQWQLYDIPVFYAGGAGRSAQDSVLDYAISAGL